MKINKKIGIIGGAGPMTGALLLQQIIHVCQTQYNCHRDADFPYIQFINYPFSEMLEGDIDRTQVANELSDAAQSLDVNFFSIACNTLHAFINDKFPIDKCIHLLLTTKESIRSSPIVICSRTSRESKIHQQYFPCSYPPAEIQKSFDDIIDQVLSGKLSQKLSDLLRDLISKIDTAESKTIVLGCTEFSLLHHHFPIKNLEIIDPSLLVAQKLCRLYFE